MSLQLRNRASGLVLDVFVQEDQGDGKACGAWEANNGDNQMWTIKPGGDGYFMFKNKETGFALDCYQDQEYNGYGRKVGARPDNDGDNQLWRLEPSYDPGFMCIKNKATDMSLDCDMKSGVGWDGQGKQVIAWPHKGWRHHDGNENQQWSWGRNIMIKNKASGLVLDLYASEGDGKEVGSWESNGGANQKWHVTPSGDGFFNLRNAAEDMVLDEYAGSEYNGYGKKVGAWNSNSGSNQQWILEPLEDGHFCLKNKSSGFALDTDMQSAVGWGGNGKQVISWPANDGDNQAWTFVFDV